MLKVECEIVILSKTIFDIISLRIFTRRNANKYFNNLIIKIECVNKINAVRGWSDKYLAYKRKTKLLEK